MNDPATDGLSLAEVHAAEGFSTPAGRAARVTGRFDTREELEEFILRDSGSQYVTAIQACVSASLVYNTRRKNCEKPQNI